MIALPVGVIAHQLFTGRLPYDLSYQIVPIQAMTELAMKYTANQPIDPIGALCPNLSDDTVQTIMACLSLNPQERPGAGTVLDQLVKERTLLTR